MKTNAYLVSDFQPARLLPGLILLCILAAACNQKPSAGVQPAAKNQTDSVKHRFTPEMVDNKKDPSCGMPVTAGIMDTVHYNGKVYGFCSDECKQLFLKDPGTLAKNAEMK
jgi:YHS domain-containing protein